MAEDYRGETRIFFSQLREMKLATKRRKKPKTKLAF